MKIDGQNPFLNSSFQVQPKEQRPERETSSQTIQGNTGPDRLEFSVASKQLHSYQAAARNAPEVRTERVADISRQLQAGTYNIKAEKVADAIITGSILDNIV